MLKFLKLLRSRPGFFFSPATLLTGTLVFLSFPLWQYSWFLWVSFFPFLLLLRKIPTWKRAVFEGYGVALLMTLGGFYWISFTLEEFGNFHPLLAKLTLILFSLICQPQLYLFPIAYRWIQRTTPKHLLSLRPLLVSATFVVLEWGMPKLFTDTLGHALYPHPWIRQTAEVWGVYGLTFLILWCNETITDGMEWIETKLEASGPTAPAQDLFNFTSLVRDFPQRFSAIGFIGVLLVSVLWGKSRFEFWKAQENSPEKWVNLAVIQANIGNFEKLASEQGVIGAADQVVKRYLSMSKQAVQKWPETQAVIWPETAYPTRFLIPAHPSEAERDQWIQDAVLETKRPLYFGSYSSQDKRDFNVVFFLTPPFGHSTERSEQLPAFQDLKIYRKHHLLLFGEYLPFADTFPQLLDYFPMIGQFGKGPGPQTIEFPLPTFTAEQSGTLRVAPLICYEALFPKYSIESARADADVLLNVTNDGWYGNTSGPWHHLVLTTFRSIETRVPQLRATNSGVTALVLPSGELTDVSGVNEQKEISVRVPLFRTKALTSADPGKNENPSIKVDPTSLAKQTLMLKWGEWFPKLCSLVMALWTLGLCLWRHRQNA